MIRFFFIFNFGIRIDLMTLKAVLIPTVLRKDSQIHSRSLDNFNLALR